MYRGNRYCCSPVQKPVSVRSGVNTIPVDTADTALLLLPLCGPAYRGGQNCRCSAASRLIRSKFVSDTAGCA